MTMMERMDALEQKVAALYQKLETRPVDAAAREDAPIIPLETMSLPIERALALMRDGGFRGARGRVLWSASDESGLHTIRVVEYEFADSVVPYVEVEEAAGHSDAPARIYSFSAAVHALQNLHESEVWTVGNRLPRADEPIERTGPGETIGAVADSLGVNPEADREVGELLASAYGAAEYPLLPPDAVEFESDGMRALRFTDTEGDPCWVRTKRCPGMYQTKWEGTVWWNGDESTMEDEDLESPSFPWLRSVWAEMRKLDVLVSELESQDNLATSDPIYMVQEKFRIWGIDPEHNSDGFEWYSPELDGTVPDDEISDYDRDDFTKAHYRDEWVNSQPFLTRMAASEYIERQRHNLKSPRIYVESGYHNREWRWLREFLPGIKSERAQHAEELEAKERANDGLRVELTDMQRLHAEEHERREEAESERDEATARAEKAEERVRELGDRRKRVLETGFSQSARIASLQSEVTRLTAQAEEARRRYVDLRNAIADWPLKYEGAVYRERSAILDAHPPLPVALPESGEETGE